MLRRVWLGCIVFMGCNVVLLLGVIVENLKLAKRKILEEEELIFGV